MKPSAGFALLVLAALAASAAYGREAMAPSAPHAPLADQDTMPAYPPVEYRFDNPQLLTQQVLWGIFHGVRLLGLACQTRGDHGAALAYAEWAEKQQARIRIAERDLARYYYRRDDASPEAISQALGLKPALAVAPEMLDAACKTLPEALRQERYDLEKFYVQRRAAALPGTWKEPGEPAIEHKESQLKEQP